MYKLAFPIISTRYWYFNAYIVVAILVSLIKPELDKLKNSYVFLLCGVSFIVATLESTIGIELLNLKNGYSPMWVLLLYLWGYGLKRLNNNALSNCAFIYFIGYIVSSLFICTAWLHLRIKLVCRYTSPFVLIQALCLLLFFKKISINNQFVTKMLTLIKPSIFGVYIIHFESVIWNVIIRPICKSILTKTGIMCMVNILLVAILIEITCILIEYIRLKSLNLLIPLIEK